MPSNYPLAVAAVRFGIGTQDRETPVYGIVFEARSGPGVHVQATLGHEQRALRHEAAAAAWEARGDGEWAEFERRCAALERACAALEADRSNLARPDRG
jgi:hypothetical protein